MPQTTRPGCLGIGRGAIGAGSDNSIGPLAKILSGLNGLLLQGGRRADDTPPAHLHTRPYD